MTSTSCSAERSSSETAAAGSERTTSSMQASGEHDGALARDLGLEGNAQADVHVGRAQLAPVLGGRQLDAGERLDGAAGRGHSADGLQLRQQSIALE